LGGVLSLVLQKRREPAERKEGGEMNYAKQRKKVYYWHNRKWRKRWKMNERDWQTIYKNGKPHSLHGIPMEIVALYCKSSSIETFKKIQEKIKEDTDFVNRLGIRAEYLL
jgi:hypothetical protein